MGNINHAHGAPKELSLPGSDPAADINLNSLMKMQNTVTVEWYGQSAETWEPWPEPVFYKLFLDPEGRNASLSATKVISELQKQTNVGKSKMTHHEMEKVRLDLLHIV